MSTGAVAERYARALFELGQEGGILGPLTEQIQRFAELYTESPELRAVLDNPVVAPEKREAVLSDIASRLGLGQIGANAIRYLSHRRRLAALPDIARRLASLADEKSGILRASVTTAAQLSESFYEKLRAELEALTGKKVVLERKQDPSLIAGVVTRIGDNVVDGSVRVPVEVFAKGAAPKWVFVQVAPHAVPEPSSAVLLVVAGMVAAFHRRRR